MRIDKIEFPVQQLLFRMVAFSAFGWMTMPMSVKSVRELVGRVLCVVKEGWI